MDLDMHTLHTKSRAGGGVSATEHVRELELGTRLDANHVYSPRQHTVILRHRLLVAQQCINGMGREATLGLKAFEAQHILILGRVTLFNGFAFIAVLNYVGGEKVF